MKPVLFSNAYSLYNQTALAGIRAVAEAQSIHHHVLEAADLAEPSRIDAMLVAAQGQGCDTLIANGGDGTLDLLLTRLRLCGVAGWQPDVLLLRGGTTNMTHGDVGFGRDPARALTAAMSRRTPFTHATRHLICLSGGSLPHPHYGFFFGTHAIARAIRQTHSEFHARNVTNGTGEARMFARAMLRLLHGRVEGDAILSPTPLHYTHDGVAQHASHVCLVATTLHRHVLGLRLSAPGNQMGCLLLTTPTYGVWRYIPSLWRGRPNQAEGALQRWQDDALTLMLDSEVTLDGELFLCNTNAPLQVSLDAAVRFLT